METRFLEKLIERIDRLDSGSLQSQFLRLAHEKGLMETIFHAIQEGIIVLDGRERITYANRAAEKLLGFSFDSAGRDPIKKYLKDIEWDRVLHLDEGEWSRLLSREIETTYPEHRFLDFYVVPLALVNPDEEGAVVILRDITRERENEVQTIESERLHAITLLAASVAHEIGNPLNSLHIHLQLLDREISNLSDNDRKPLGELIGVALQEVGRLDQIISQFLKALRPVQPELESAKLDDLVKETVDFMRQEIEDRNVLVEITDAEDLPVTQMDKGQMKQAVFNIIRNALQAMPGGGLLAIRFAATDRFAAVSFRDSGTGISPEDLGRVFEPYHTTKQGGSGLGLMIVQRVIRDHGGEIEVESEPDTGTTITLFLPREDRRIRLLKGHRSAKEGRS